jgi:beta-galactosidase
LPHAPVVIDHRHFTKDELGVWGMKWESAEFTGFIDDKAVAHLRMAADPLPTTLAVEADSRTLQAEGRDSVRIIVRALDQAGNILPFLNDAVDISVQGPARLIGPERVVFQGGSTGFWLESTGSVGDILVTVTSSRLGAAKLALSATTEGAARA